MFSIYTDYSDGTDYTAAAYIRNCFDNTKNGILFAYGPCRDEDNESDTIFRYRMNWTEADRDSLIVELEAFCHGQGTLSVKEDGLYAQEVHTRCRRFHRLMELNAPNMVIQTEAFFLAAVALLNRFASEATRIYPHRGTSTLCLKKGDSADVAIFIDGVDLCTLLSPNDPEEYGHLDVKTLSNTLKDEHGVIACCGDCGWPGCWDAIVKIVYLGDTIQWTVSPHGAERSPLHFAFDRKAYEASIQ